MRKAFAVAVVLIVVCWCFSTRQEARGVGARVCGDLDDDGVATLTDAIVLIQNLFLDGPRPPACWAHLEELEWKFVRGQFSEAGAHEFVATLRWEGWRLPAAGEVLAYARVRAKSGDGEGIELHLFDREFGPDGLSSVWLADRSIPPGARLPRNWSLELWGDTMRLRNATAQAGLALVREARLER